MNNNEDEDDLERDRVRIRRPSLEWEDFSTKFGKRDLGHELDYSSRIVSAVSERMKKWDAVTYLVSMFPFLTWIQRYSVKDYLISDIVVGFTVGVLHLPQGLAYGMLAQVEPINGLYVSFFPVLVYGFMATTRHTSIGTSAIVSVMLNSAVAKLTLINPPSCYHQMAQPVQPIPILDGPIVTDSQTVTCITNLEAVTTICFTTGIIMLVMGLFHLGSLSLILSDQIVSAFVSGSALHVATSQLKNFTGLQLDGGKGTARIVHIWISLGRNIMNAKIPTLIVSTVSIILLILAKEIGEPRLKKNFHSLEKMPIPTDLFAIIVSTLISWYLQLGPNHGLEIMKSIPTGIQAPIVPRVDIVGHFLTDSFAIAIISFTVCSSLGKIHAKEHKYRMVPNQELIAMGGANLFSSFFSCFPCSCSLSRSAVQSSAGGKTHLVTFISCFLILIVLLLLAPLLYHLPKCTLAVVTLVAVKSLLMQFKQLFKYWNTCRLEAATWIVTFAAVVLIDIDLGLLVGEFFNIDFFNFSTNFLILVLSIN